MMWWESMRIALRALRAGKLRSFLTMLGVIIGVASVIAVVAVGAGARAQIADQIRSLGSNVLMVYSLSSSSSQSDGSISRRLLNEQDADAIAEQIPLVLAASPYGWTAVDVIRGNRNASAVLWGTNSDYFTIREWPLMSGRHFLPEEEASAGKQAILGAEIAKRLFGTDDPVGAEVRVQNVPFQIIGVLAERGAMGAARTQDDDLFAPIATVNRRVRGSLDDVHRDAVEYILIKVVSEAAMEDAKAQIDSLLRQRHRLLAGQESFRIGDPAAQMAVQQDTTTTFAWLLTSVASISLLVGGISIMNIMLVSVRERTREIGIRIAVGARRRDIRDQFLLEAVVLCLSGGLIGVALGVVVTLIVSRAAGWPVFIGIDGIVLALGFAAATGIFFGWYPARQAARLQPVEALRSE